ncbi:MAG: peroxiredoxin [Flavobacteriales bacterium]|nr:peroxiredoxin [Flavobacteriales bacterium]
MSQLLHKQAPVFALPNQDGRVVDMAEYFGKVPVVLFFYPGDFTPGCTREACAFRDVYQELSRAGVAVFGISADSVEKHRRFREAYQLPYDLLSDKDDRVARLYGVGKTFFLKDRVTFLIDANGAVMEVYKSPIRFERHARLALEKLASAP